ncbi:microtubule-associated protein 9 isoform X1 [Nothobranchius furzeri]|uniref:Microtubule-associated protein 9 n=1 Tax=Nothobranchius furzeri TaxID=105023 RepID=A0A1A8ASU9_NOTFU|nr:transcript variant X1 [Nothobranchius furzeri]
MTDQEVRTLAYSKSPKTTKRTTFQDELQAAVFARTSKTKAEPFSKDTNEVEDELLNKLLHSRKKRIDAFKASKNKTKLNNFDLSDDEDKDSRPKKVSFLKSQKNGSDSQNQTASEHHENKASESFSSESISSKHSTNLSEQNLQSTNEEATDSLMTRKTSSRSYQTSDDSLTLPLPSDGSVVEAPGQEKEIVAVAETSDTPQSSTSSFNNNISAECVAEREPPKPKPRQRTFGLNSHTSEKPVEETETQDPNRPQTSSVSVLCSTDTSSHNNWTDQTNSPVLNKSSYQSTQSQLQSTFDSVSRDDGKETEENYSTSFEEFNGCSRDLSTQLSCDPDNSSHSKKTARSQSVGSKKMESNYLGNLKVLDRKISLQESQPQAAESLRAAVYQEWLKTKRETLRQNVQLKKKEKLLKEKEKMQEQEAKRESAVASFKAWEEKKAENLRAKANEMSRRIRKEQKATEDKEEKRQSAKQVFEKWKQEQDHLLREKYRQQKDAENKLLLQKQEKKEERKMESKLAFSDWCERKKGVFHEKLKKERKEIQTKVEEEQYMNEEKEKMALEMYENWLKRKDLEQKRTREERRVREIIQDSPPPPWSPPNKTVPFKK